jgi:methylase of polypeptide subunit release factors
VVGNEDPRVELLGELKGRGYAFTAVTPATHRIILSRPLHGRATLADVFGWNRPFQEQDLDARLLALLEDSGLLARNSGMLKSRVRVASLGDDLFLHSAFPTDDEDAVFFGPDSYRFVRFIKPHLQHSKSEAHIVDMGAGSGVGGIVAARLVKGAAITLVDSNAAALELARINAIAAGMEVTLLQSRSVPSGADIVIANPPYMMDPQGRTYRDGGDLLGGGLALEWAEHAIRELKAGGTLLLYTGAAFRSGRSPLLEALEHLCRQTTTSLSLEEIDPDVFGDELLEPAYREVERIAAVGAVLRRGS